MFRQTEAQMRSPEMVASLRQQIVEDRASAQPSDWKMCFRAGREAVTAARTAAQAWLRELPSALP
jgi:hypothetical protein